MKTEGIKNNQPLSRTTSPFFSRKDLPSNSPESHSFFKPSHHLFQTKVPELIQAARTTGDPNSHESGLMERLALWKKYALSRATNAAVRRGLQMWVAGDRDRGINWNMIGQHLRGNLTENDYEPIGAMYFLRTEICLKLVQ